MKVFLKILVGLIAISGSGCITTKSEGFVNYKVVGDVQRFRAGLTL